MAIPNIFDLDDCEKAIERINRLTRLTEPQWGIMNVGQMLAHLNVSYEMVYENKHPKPNFLKKFFLKKFVKNIVVSEVPYKHNSKTAPAFVIKENKNFDAEKRRLINYIRKTQELGEEHFHNKESLSFGPLTKTEWNNMFGKHLHHHLTQFGV
jgi:hypothetical protein